MHRPTLTHPLPHNPPCPLDSLHSKLNLSRRLLVHTAHPPPRDCAQQPSVCPPLFPLPPLLLLLSRLRTSAVTFREQPSTLRRRLTSLAIPHHIGLSFASDSSTDLSTCVTEGRVHPAQGCSTGTHLLWSLTATRASSDLLVDPVTYTSSSPFIVDLLTPTRKPGHAHKQASPADSSIPQSITCLKRILFFFPLMPILLCFSLSWYLTATSSIRCH